MNISAATLLTSQLAQAPSATGKSGVQQAEFSPLLFKKTAASPVQSTASAPSAPEPAPIRTASVTTPATGPRAAYQRPGSTIDIKV
jgi:hypothetical protein